MACNMWEEMGLLFSSGELNEQEQQVFTEHMQQCPECAGEWETYQKEKKQFFTIEVLGEAPSSACDAEILRVCSSSRRRAESLRLFPLFLKKSAISLALFFIGFTIVGYLVLKMDSSNPQKTATVTVKESENSTQTTAPATETALDEQFDSVTDSSHEKSVNFAKQRGNLDFKGVYPVDLQNK